MGMAPISTYTAVVEHLSCRPCSCLSSRLSNVSSSCSSPLESMTVSSPLVIRGLQNVTYILCATSGLIPFLPCSPAPSKTYIVRLPFWILEMSFPPSDCLIRPMCFVDCTSYMCRFPMVHFCGSLFRLLLTKTTSLFEALIVTLSFCVSFCFDNYFTYFVPVLL